MEGRSKKAEADFDEYKKILNKNLDLAKMNFEKREIEKKQKEPKKVWDFVNDKIGKKAENKITSIKFLLDKNNK